MIRSRRTHLVALTLTSALVAGAVASTATANAEPADSSSPTKVLVVLFDQMRPEYADRFNMPNFRALRDSGTNFNEAYLGYMGSETVIAHNVLMSGQTPRNMGWVDEAYRDRDTLLGSDPDQMYITGELTYDQYGTLIQDKGYPKLADYLQDTQPGKKFIVVGQKSYAVESAAAKSAFDTSDADIAVRFSSRTSSARPPDTQPDEQACFDTLGGRYRGPTGINVPTYISQPFCNRYWVNSGNTYGTSEAFPSWIYPLDGNRFVPGYDPNHLGGDAWVADASMAMMEIEDWSGMFVTLGGIDKAGHMWGAQNDRQSVSGSPDYQTHVQYAAEFADVQLGLMLDKLEALGQLDDTLVVLTADHGATWGEEFYGKTAAGSSSSDTNWYYGPDSLPSVYNNPSPALQPLIDTGNVAFSYQSTSIQTWLTSASQPKRTEALKAMTALPGVIATYWKNGGKYSLYKKNRIPSGEKQWFKSKAQAIVNTMADANGPDLVALLRDKVSYGAYGDHGGYQESNQRVPMVFWSTDGQYARDTSATFRTPDVMPTILRVLGIEQTYPTDGQARSLD